MFGIPSPWLIGGAASLVLLTGVTSCSAFKFGQARAAAERLAKAETARADKATGDLIACRTSLDNVTGALETQNEAVEQLKTDSDARIARAEAAVKAAQVTARTYRARAQRIAAARPGPDQCMSARELIVSSLAEERQ